MTPARRLPRPIAWLLFCLPLGDRRADVEADFSELFDLRRREHGTGYATSRLLFDMASLFRLRRQRSRLTQDLRFGLRLFRKHPAAIGIATLGLALAIGAVTAVYSLLNAVLLRPFKMDDPSSVYSVAQQMHSRPWPEWPYHRFLQLQRLARSSDIVASEYQTARFGTSYENEGAEELPVLFVSGNYLQTLGGRPSLGRTLAPSDDAPGAPPVIVASHFTWTKKLKSDASIVGKVVYINGSPATLVGVISPAFDGPVFQPSAFWAPLGAADDLLHGEPFTESTRTFVEVTARLRPGVTPSAAESELQAIAANDPRLTAEAPPARPPAVTLHSAATPSSGLKALENYAATAAILSLIGLVLALACANAANLMLAGAVTRVREMGLRLALGATRRRLIRQLVTESVLLGMFSGGLGVIVAIWLTPMLASALAIPPAVDVSLDVRVLIFAIAVAVATGLGAAIAPARYGVRGNLVTALNAQGGQTGEAPRASRLRKVFIAFQAAVSIVLLVGAALLTRTALSITGAGPGFDADRLLAVSSSVARASVEEPGYIDRAIDVIRALPEVERASVSQYQPFGDSTERARMVNDGSYSLYRTRADEEYFATMGLRIIRGRGFTRDEVAREAPVALLSEDVVRRFFDGVDPVGRSLAGTLIAPAGSAPVVIGIVADMMPNRIRTEGYGVIFLPISRTRSNAPTIIVRAQRPAAIARTIEQALVTLRPGARPMAEVIAVDTNKYFDEKRMMARLSTAAALLALGLAVLGVYGVSAFVIGQRAHEIGVRMAIGASRADIVRLLVGQSLRPVAIGLAVGVTIVLLGGQVLANFIAGVGPRDPVSIGGAIAILLGSALLAVVAPARKAARNDPVRILRV